MSDREILRFDFDGNQLPSQESPKMPEIDWSRIDEVTSEDVSRIKIICEEGITITEEIDWDIRKTVAEMIKCMQLEAWDPVVKIFAKTEDSPYASVDFSTGSIELKISDALIDYNKVLGERREWLNSSVEIINNENSQNKALKYLRRNSIAHECYHIQQAFYDWDYLIETLASNKNSDSFDYYFNKGEIAALGTGIRALEIEISNFKESQGDLNILKKMLNYLNAELEIRLMFKKLLE